jgi:hypothetical protein
MTGQTVPAPLYDFAVAVREFALLCIAKDQGEENKTTEDELEQVA